jgi:hypothetical protein
MRLDKKWTENNITSAFDYLLNARLQYTTGFLSFGFSTLEFSL